MKPGRLAPGLAIFRRITPLVQAGTQAASNAARLLHGQSRKGADAMPVLGTTERAVFEDLGPRTAFGDAQAEAGNLTIPKQADCRCLGAPEGDVRRTALWHGASV